MPSRPSPADYRRLHDFRYSIRRFLHFSEEAIREAGIEPQQHQLLLAIKARSDASGLGVRDIAERLLLRHHSAVELVDRAETRGLVSRHPDENDRRQVLIRLTPAGEQVLARLAAAHLDELRTSAPELIDVLAAIVDQAAPAAVPVAAE